MNEGHQYSLNLMFLVLGVIFFLFEKLSPDRKISIMKELKVDVLAFFLLLSTAPLISHPLTKCYQSYNVPYLSGITLLGPPIKILLATLLTDFLNYWVHYWMHQSDWYWKTHAFHHRIENLYWFSGLRASLGHYLSFILTRVTVGVLIFQLNSNELFYYYAWGLGLNFLQHANSNLFILNNKLIEWILVTPRIHRYHHSKEGKRLKNLGTIFSFWDRAFGTYIDPEGIKESYALGLKSPQQSFWREFIGV